MIDERRNLAYRNLTRANMVSLATGQQMAAFMRSKGVSVTTLTKAQIRDGKGAVTLDTLSKKQRARVVTDTPLWFYILREAELVSEIKVGRNRLYELNAGPLKNVDDWLAHYRHMWQHQLRNLKRFVEQKGRTH